MNEELRKEMDALSKDIKSMIDEGKASGEKVSDDLKNAVTKWNEKHEKMLQENEDYKKSTQEQLDQLQTAIKDYEEKAKDATRSIKTVKGYFMDSLKDNEMFARYKDHRADFNMPINPALMKGQLLRKDILVADDFTGDVIQPDRVTNEIFSSPHNPTRVRDIIGVGTTMSDTVSFVRSTSTRNAAAVAEGAAKAQSEEAFTEVTEPIQVIAHYFRVSNQALNDFAQMATYLQVEGVAGLKDVEDTQILNGSGVSPNLNGIITQAGTTYAGGTDNSDDTHIDVLVKAYWQLMTLKYMPSFIMIDPASMKTIQLTKATDGQYIYPNFQPIGLRDWAINGVPLIAHHAVPSDTFLIGDGRKTLLWDREQVNVRFSEHDATNFTTNKTTVRIEERLAVAVYDTAAFISATFTNAKDSLT